MFEILLSCEQILSHCLGVLHAPSLVADTQDIITTLTHNNSEGKIHHPQFNLS